jgi:hypothetical protein
LIDAVVSRAKAMALHFDKQLAHAVGVHHPRAAVESLPVANGWIGVAAETLVLLQSDMSFPGKLRGEVVRLAQTCKLADEQAQRRAAKR